MRAFTSRSHRSSQLAVVGLLTLALVINGPMATGMSMTDTAGAGPERLPVGRADPRGDGRRGGRSGRRGAGADDARDRGDRRGRDRPSDGRRGARSRPGRGPERVRPRRRRPGPDGRPGRGHRRVRAHGRSGPDGRPGRGHRRVRARPRPRSPLPPTRRRQCPRTPPTAPRSRSSCPASRWSRVTRARRSTGPTSAPRTNYVVQFEQADGTWKTVEKDVEPADLCVVEGPVAPVDNQATVENLKNGKDYTARIVSADTLATQRSRDRAGRGRHSRWPTWDERCGSSRRR